VGGDDFTTSTFNHVGLCVRDLDSSRRFYESALGFEHERDLAVPDEAAAALLGLTPPLGLRAVYLRRDGFVLELLAYAARQVVEPARARTMDEVGLTHMSLSVPDLAAALAGVRTFGGTVLDGTLVAGVAVFVRDPDGQLIELLAR